MPSPRILLSLILLSGIAWAQPRLAQQLPDVELQTSFAHDYGEILQAVRYHGKDYQPSQATQAILTSVAWSSRDDRRLLGEAWVREVVLFGSTVLERAQPEPKSEILPDGTFRFTARVMNLRGRNPGGVSLQRIEISPTAELKVTHLTDSQAP